ncbi:hypothetical protein ERJ75_001354200 [Trypanosoma vivax]|uniref:Uncharacterized protein n=1 Tax=Trypanosoma vivax (strain Y486) TaxID=1055687 RepID=G0UCV9_TRYVY|nr:hypothetical protein TRVL_00883 [Trypanosoma vivax]KAH8608071.1 hypothetical protein ERJ75_001354200 [Trypanosoma vivax]CCC53669.1 conserved hypothetical protein [Trypanosoma vivax Y486]
MEMTVKQRVLTKEELERSVNRLSVRRAPEVKLLPLCPKRVLSQEERERSLKHLYDDSIERKKLKLNEIERSINAEIQRYHDKIPKITSTEIDDMVGRLYAASIARKQNALRELYERETSSNARQLKRLGKKEQQEFVMRLYEGGMADNRKKHIALFEEYVLAKEPKMVRRSPVELAAACDRLTSGKGIMDD